MKPYPKMSVDEFTEYISNVMDDYPNEDYYWLVAVLCNDENSTDDDLKNWLVIENYANKNLVNKFLEMREYFLDFRYSQCIFDNSNKY